MKISISRKFLTAAIVLLASVLSDHKTNALSFGSIKDTATDVVKLGAKTSVNVAKKIPDLVPTPDNLYTISKQTLIGLPFELLLAGIDKLCSIALSANNATEPYKQPKIDEMNYVLMTDNENISIPITESLKLWLHEKFDTKKKVVIMVTGWNSDIDNENTAAEELWSAYQARNDTNFVLIDTARYVDTLYAWSAFNTQELGKGLGQGLAELINVVPLENIHLMGHSLGYDIAVYYFICGFSLERYYYHETSINFTLTLWYHHLHSYRISRKIFGWFL